MWGSGSACWFGPQFWMIHDIILVTLNYRWVGVSSTTLFTSASKSSIRRFVITEKAPTWAFSWLKAATTAFTFKTLLRHFAKQALTPRYLNVKLGQRCNYHE